MIEVIDLRAFLVVAGIISLLDWVPVLAVAGNQETHTEGEEWVEKSGSPSWAWVTVQVVCSKALNTTVTPERKNREAPSDSCTMT
jgi:hypothetical protein